ncbi:MAG TPA: glycosyltransferase [Acidimicrobiales bacterium]
MKRDVTVDGRPSYICFSGQDWWYFSRAHSDFQLMLRVARDRPVLFVNSITMRMPLPGKSSRFWMRIWRKAQSMTKLLRRPVPDVPGFAVLSPIIIPFYGVSWLRRFNAWSIGLQVRLALRRLGMSRPTCLVTIPTAWDVLAHLEHGPVVFNRSDRHSAFEEAHQGTIRAMETELLRGADHVLYVSDVLMRDEAAMVGNRALFLDHGVDADHFRRHPPEDVPADVRDLRHPVIGFFGGFDDYVVDLDLIAHVARSFPDATILLIGDANCSMRWTEDLPNVRWLGPRDYNDIPAYGSCFDVAIMPWLDNEWIRHANPIKMKEYLALELAVVSTDFPEVHRYDGVIRIATDRDSFVDLIRLTLADGGLATPEQRRAAVVDASWDRRAAELLEVCEG